MERYLALRMYRCETFRQQTLSLESHRAFFICFTGRLVTSGVGQGMEGIMDDSRESDSVCAAVRLSEVVCKGSIRVVALSVCPSLPLFFPLRSFLLAYPFLLPHPLFCCLFSPLDGRHPTTAWSSGIVIIIPKLADVILLAARSWGPLIQPCYLQSTDKSRLCWGQPPSLHSLLAVWLAPPIRPPPYSSSPSFPSPSRCLLASR